MNARECAFRALKRCTQQGSWSSQTLDSEIRRSSDGSESSQRDTALASRIVLGVLQNLYLLDFYIDSFAAKPDKLDPDVRNILRMGAFQLKLMDRVPPHAAVSESVELCRKYGYKSACGLVNAVLRKIAGPCPEPDSLSVRYSHPQWFVSRLTALYGEQFAEGFLAADNTEPAVDTHPGFAEGETYVQDNAAWEAVRMLSPQPGSRVLDVCSAPGGKSFTAAMMMENRGEIISCDIHEKKLRLVSEGAERLGIGIIRVFPADAGEYRPEFDSAFDAVIADVPCSGFGVIRKKPEIRYKTEQEIAGLPAIQRRILDNVSRYVKPGGKLLYSTCTVFPEENDDIVSAFLKDTPTYSLVSQRSFFPNTDNTDGFFAAVLERKV
ncbi:MAG: transcription antitermination factor NusB [Eubacteriales bacterium]|nr:transcription antitermination factor NusB [Eubacteriales bacterium]